MKNLNELLIDFKTKIMIKENTSTKIDKCEIKEYLKYKNILYFENLTDDCFFNRCGPTNDFVLFYKKIIKSGVKNIILGGVNIGLDKKHSEN